MTATYSINSKLNGIEITFSEIPAAYIRNLLKSSGFAWHRVKGLWYNRYTEENENLCKAIVEQTQTPQEVPQEEPQKPAKKPSRAPLWERVQASELPAYGTENAVKDAIKATAREKGWGYDRAAAAHFRTHLRERFPECKFSITSGKAGWLNNCEISLISSPYEKDGPEVDAIMNYANKLHDAADADDGDYYADYGAHHDLYGSASVSWDYTQTAQTDADRAEVEAFRAAKAEAEAQEEERRAREWAEDRARREKEAQEAEERERVESARAAEVEAAAVVVDYYEGEQLTFTELLGGGGKESSAEELTEYVAEYGGRTEDAIISRKVTFQNADDLKFFEKNFLRDWSFLAGKGGMKSADVRVNDENYSRLSAEQRESVKWYMIDCVAVYLGSTLLYIIDPEGYNYARYVYIPTGNTKTIPAAVYEGREEAESLEKEPLYIPEPIHTQIDSADLRAGDPFTVLTVDGWMCSVTEARGKVVDLAPCTYAQYTDSGRLDFIPAGKRKGRRLYFHTGGETVIYKGILPAVPDSLKYEEIPGSIMRRVRYAGNGCREYLREVVKYYAGLGYTPAVDTFQR